MSVEEKIKQIEDDARYSAALIQDDAAGQMAAEELKGSIRAIIAMLRKAIEQRNRNGNVAIGHKLNRKQIEADDAALLKAAEEASHE